MDISEKIVKYITNMKPYTDVIELFESLLASSSNLLNICINHRYTRYLIYSDHMTYLSLAIMNDRVDIVEYLLGKGANILGITNEGICMDSPITFASFIDDINIFKNMIDLLLINGADINGVGISNVTLLGYLAQEYVDYERIEYVLKKGADPNGTFVSRPLVSIVQNKYFDADMIEPVKILLKYGAVLDEKYVVDDMVKIIYEEYKLLFEKNIKDIQIPDFIEKVVRAYNIPIKNIKNIYGMKEDLINYIGEMDKPLQKSTHKTFQMYVEEKRSKSRKSNNDTTLIGDSIHIFGDNNLMRIVDEKFEWYFHMSEIPHIIKSGKNPYTLQEISKKSIEKMVKLLDYFPYYSQYEDVFLPVSYSLENYTSHLSNIIKTLNPYINIYDIEKVRLQFYKELPYLLQNYFQVNIVYLLQGNSRDKNYKKIVLERLSIMLLDKLQKYQITLSLIIQVFDQIIKDNDMMSHILNILQINENNKNVMYNIFRLSGNNLKNYIGEKKWQDIHNTISDYGQPFDEYWSYLSTVLSNH